MDEAGRISFSNERKISVLREILALDSPENERRVIEALAAMDIKITRLPLRSSERYTVRTSDGIVHGRVSLTQLELLRVRLLPEQ